MIKPNYKILFHLENNEVELLEIKRSGILSDDKSKIYYWLLYDKVNDMLSHLIFSSMKSEENKEYRKFEGYSLEFDQESGKLTEKGKNHTLKIVPIETALSAKLKEAIGDYLILLNFRSSL